MSQIKDPDPSILDPQLRSILEIDEGDDKNYLYCAACGNVITATEQRIAVNGDHHHHFTNPHGFEFDVGCFAQALGCDISGQPEAADTWFMDHVWQLATCAHCHEHMGWYFSHLASDNAFYGLILANLRSTAERD